VDRHHAGGQLLRPFTPRPVIHCTMMDNACKVCKSLIDPGPARPARLGCYPHIASPATNLAVRHCSA
ncbi:MAG: hypothetical protein ABI379_02715, partial [Rhodanobacter sp.]